MPVAALMGAVVSVQYGATLAADLFLAVGAEGATTLRLGMGAAILAAAMRPWRTRVPRAALPALFGYGLTLGFMNLLFYMALRRIPLGVAVAIEFSGPLLVAALSSRRAADIAWVGLAAAGLLLLSPAAHTNEALDPVGALFALAAGGLWAMYMLFGRKAGNQLGLQATAFGVLIAAVVTLPIGIAHAGGTMLQPAVLASGALVGVFSSAVPFALEMAALTRMPIRVYGTLMSTEPAVGAFMGLLLLHQTLGPLQWAGIAMIVAASVGAAAAMRPPAASAVGGGT